jgi:hypothetical protein
MTKHRARTVRGVSWMVVLAVVLAVVKKKQESSKGDDAAPVDPEVPRIVVAMIDAHGGMPAGASPRRSRSRTGFRWRTIRRPRRRRSRLTSPRGALIPITKRPRKHGVGWKARLEPALVATVSPGSARDAGRATSCSCHGSRWIRAPSSQSPTGTRCGTAPRNIMW